MQASLGTFGYSCFNLIRFDLASVFRASVVELVDLPLQLMDLGLLVTVKNQVMTGYLRFVFQPVPFCQFLALSLNAVSEILSLGVDQTLPENYSR